MSLNRKEKVRWGRSESFIESSSAQDLKLTINPLTKDFVLEKKRPRASRVEGRVVAGMETITKIMMFKPGIRRGGLVEVLSLQIRDLTGVPD